MDIQKIVKALWALRHPDDLANPCMWVQTCTWRFDRGVLIVTQLEQPSRIHYRLWGHIRTDEGTQFTEHGGEYRESVIYQMLWRIGVNMCHVTENGRTMCADCYEEFGKERESDNGLHLAYVRLWADKESCDCCSNEPLVQ